MYIFLYGHDNCCLSVFGRSFWEECVCVRVCVCVCVCVCDILPFDEVGGVLVDDAQHLLVHLFVCVCERERVCE
jgi:hypothetical protein